MRTEGNDIPVLGSATEAELPEREREPHIGEKWLVLSNRLDNKELKALPYRGLAGVWERAKPAAIPAPQTAATEHAVVALVEKEEEVDALGGFGVGG